MRAGTISSDFIGKKIRNLRKSDKKTIKECIHKRFPC